MRSLRTRFVAVLTLGAIGMLGFASQQAAPKVGDTVPDFTLTDTDGKSHKLSELVKKDGVNAVVLEWFNPDCPFVKKHHSRHPTMRTTYEQFKDEGVRWLAVNSGGKGKQGHGTERNAQARKDYEIAYPVLLDEDGKVGRAYGATNTPHMYIVSNEMKLVYIGAVDNDRRNIGDINYVELALKAHLAGETIDTPTTRPYGCSVKYGK